jgi:alpha-beta hydrolase superfamily lysophospholipase
VITRRVRTADGVDLALHRLPAGLGRRAAVLLVHGAFSSHTIWLMTRHPDGGLAQFLGERGFDVWLADLRHHGESAREPRPFTWRFEDLILADAPALVARVREETDDAPLAWLGHSAGGAVGLAWLARQAGADPPAAMVTFGAPGPRDMSLPRRLLALGTIAICRTLGRFPARALGMGSEDEAALVLGDWMSWNVGGRWLGRDGFDYLAALAAARTPYLGVAGAADHLFAPPDACRQIVDAMGGGGDFAVVGPGLDHPGMLTDPRAREQCWPRVAAWLEETVPT